MGAPFGNQFWKLIPKPGAGKTFDTPEELWDVACMYFQWCDTNPYKYDDWVGGAAKKVEREKPLPYTIEGLCLHIGISTQTFFNYSKKEGYEAFFDICTCITDIIRQQKFAGATAGIFNHSIIARDLGLVDKVDSKTEGKQEIIVKYERKHNGNTE